MNTAYMELLKDLEMTREEVVNKLKLENADGAITSKAQFINAFKTWTLAQGLNDGDTQRILDDLNSYPEYKQNNFN